MQFLEERKKVLTVAKDLSESGLVIGTWGNVSARCQGHDLMIITPSGMNYKTMGLSDLVLVDADGGVVQGNYKPSTESALHMGIYRARPQVNAVVHTHSTFASAFAVAGVELPIILEEMAQVIGNTVETAEYATCGTEALADVVIAALGQDREAVFLANHGLVALGSSPKEALTKANVVEKACQIYIYAELLGGSKSIPEEEIATLREAYKSYGQNK